MAKSYEEVERNYTKTTTARDTTKKQLEQYGYSLDESGNVIQVNPMAQPSVRDNQYQPYGQPQQTQEVIYDPYTGQAISDPVARQLATMPLGQREVFLFNALLSQRDQMTTASNKVASEVLSSPEAKGFEDDVRNVMQHLASFLS